MTRRRAKKPAARPLAVALIRVSKGAVIQELGAEAQRHAIEGWAAREGYDLVWVEEVEEVSGGADMEDRPGLIEAMAKVEILKAKALVFHRFDRFAREPYVALGVERGLRKIGADLIFVEGGGSGANGLIERRVLALMAEIERMLIKSRITAALAVKKRRGELTGRAPYGMRAVDGPMRAGKDGAMRVVKVLEPDEGEQATIARARELAAREDTTVRSIQATLAAEGRLNRRGRMFGLEELHRMIRGEEAA